MKTAAQKMHMITVIMASDLYSLSCAATPEINVSNTIAKTMPSVGSAKPNSTTATVKMMTAIDLERGPQPQ